MTAPTVVAEAIAQAAACIVAEPDARIDARIDAQIAEQREELAVLEDRAANARARQFLNKLATPGRLT